MAAPRKPSAGCSWAQKLPSRARDVAQELRQDAIGGADSLAYLFHLARGNRIRRRSSMEPQGERRPILLIHGFMGTRGSMLLLERRLEADGFTVFSFNIGAINTRDIRRSAFIIHRKIERILAQSSVKQVDIVGHSMGGLIGLYYVKKLGGSTRVRRLVMMGTPLRGTWVALGGVATLGMFSTSSWQLLPGSRFLAELTEGGVPPGVEVCSIGAERDWVVPFSSTLVQGIRSIAVPLGHSSLVVSEEVYERLREVLTAPDEIVIEDHPLGDAP